MSETMNMQNLCGETARLVKKRRRPGAVAAHSLSEAGAEEERLAWM
jgi:hypothetical protein